MCSTISIITRKSPFCQIFLPYSDFGKQDSSLPLCLTQLPLCRLLKSNVGFKCLVHRTFFDACQDDRPYWPSWWIRGHCKQAKWWLWKSCNLIGQFPGLWPCGGVRLWALRQAAEGKERVCQRKEEVCSPNFLHFDWGTLKLWLLIKNCWHPSQEWAKII